MHEFNQELEDYIFEHGSPFWTPDEARAWKTHHTRIATGHSENLRALAIEKGWISTDPAVSALLADGFPAFRRRVALRIWNERRRELQLNYCPSCHKIARTPQARQCRFCGHDWH